MHYVLTFAEAAAAGPGAVGGKGWNTGRLARFGFVIPAGCVVRVEAYWDFLTQNGLMAEVEALGAIAAEEAAGEATAARLEAFRARIEAGRLPDELGEQIAAALHTAGVPADAALAVRSSATAEDSATASFAGIHRSFLNIIGADMLANAVRGCYASLWTPTAVAYRRKMGLTDRQVGGALVIQQLVMSLYSGVAFSADPVTGRRDRVVVNASFGLGEAIVSGSVEADEYHLHIDHTGPVKVVDGHIGLKHHAVRPSIDGGTVTEELGYAERSEPVLQKPQLEEISRVVRRIQDTLGDGIQPQDVEWCHDGWRLVITQARPITALPEATFPALAGQATIWSNANLKDAMPGVQSPLGWWFNSLTVEVLLRQIFWRAGYDFPEGLTWSRLYNGRVYMNLSALQWAAWDAFGWPPAETNRALGGHQPEINVPGPAPVWSHLGRQRLARMTRMGALLRRSSKGAEKAFKQVWDWCREFEQQGTGDRFHELEFLHRLWAVEKQRRQFLPETMIHNVGGLWSSRLAQLLEKRFPGRGQALASALLAGAEGITSAEQGYRLIAIARIASDEQTARAYFTAADFPVKQFRTALRGTATLKELERFLEEFGHRGVYEMELMNPRWSEEPNFVLETIRTYLRDGLPEQDLQAPARAKRSAAEAEVKAALRFSPSYPLYTFLLGKAREAMRLREGAKSALVRLVRPARMAALAIGRRLTAKGILHNPDEVFFLTGDEIASLLSSQWNGDGLREILAYRHARRDELQALPAPDVILGEKAVVNLRLEPQQTGAVREQTGVHQGVAVSSGQARGPARLIRHPSEGTALRKGEVLVAPSTDPAWTPLFLRASAVVMEVGGYLSHGAIVAREYGIPAVVNLGGAMTHFRDGQPLFVDGDTGKVRVEP
ncbi:MAG TPA: PEP/pyruvate-binding domain-containing protein [Symbiobacteriaceae bacterium]|nr:PEP/pyruvate-binding domain-containing protein [Symbiobacteriaceae bacterium]